MPLSVSILSHSEISVEEWNTFMANSAQGNVFALYEYMDIIASKWEAMIVMEENKWLAVMPIIRQKKVGFTFALQPILAQYWGIFLGNFSYKNDYETFSNYRKIVSAFIEKLSKIAVFAYHFAPNFPYAIPFRQAGYELRTRYTYHLVLSNTEKHLWDNLASPLQRQIKKTNKQAFSVHINRPQQIPYLIKIFSQNQDIGKNLTGLKEKQFQPTLDKLSQIAHYFIRSNNGILLTITDGEGNVLAGGIFGLFQDKMIYLGGGVHPQYRSEGLMSRLLWEAILYGQKNNCAIFDFEGSMIVGIETFFRKFGAFPVPYLQIVHNQLPFYLQWTSAFKF